VYYKEARAEFAGELWTQDERAWVKYGINRIEGTFKPGLGMDKIHYGGNSGYQAINLAYLWGASRIILLGYDMQKTDGKTHWHGDHPKGLHKNPIMLSWIKSFNRLADDLKDKSVEVVNATRTTALEAFRREPLRAALTNQKRVYLIQGMHGLGDNLHQRAVIKELTQKGEVWLHTPWPSVYHDIENLNLLKPITSLRTQLKNSKREADKYTNKPFPLVKASRIWYTHDEIKRCGGFLDAMCEAQGVQNRDFSLKIKPEWVQKAQDFLDKNGCNKPVLVYRPLVERTEWAGCSLRNPDFEAYHSLISAIQEHYFVVSVADLAQGVEWEVGKPINADVVAHKGELEFEVLAGLMSLSSLVFCSPGFALILAQAVGAPVVCVFGGHESPRFYDHGNKTDLLISSENPCECFNKNHKCDKQINLNYWVPKLKEFAHDYAKSPIY